MSTKDISAYEYNHRYYEAHKKEIRERAKERAKKHPVETKLKNLKFKYKKKPTVKKAINLYSVINGIKPEQIKLSIPDIMDYVNKYVNE